MAKDIVSNSGIRYSDWRLSVTMTVRLERSELPHKDRFKLYADSKYEDRRMRLLAEAATGNSVLDIGYAQSPNSYFSAEMVVGVDVEPAKEPVPYNETYIGETGSIKALKGRQFDAVVAGELIEHLEDPYSFLRDLRGMLTPGGRLVISTPNPVGFPVVAAEWFRSRRRFYTPDHTFYFAPRWVVRMLERCGYQVVETVGVGLWLPRTPVLKCPVGLSYQVIYVAVAADHHED